MKKYTAVIEKCSETNLYVGYIPGFPGAHSQAETLDELNRNLKEVVEMLLEDGDPRLDGEFIGDPISGSGIIMGNIPVLKAKQVIKILGNLGFVEVRQRGSHKQFRSNDG